ncbi:TIGR03618 family F420-dependent PPOX class oxidoreductase [Kribbella albertanoniae]|uniref:Pyridoxamine 5'-phosphate oxidase n=1 Tax=Kribbella albertanoniae TaxID=1266829 RepID=A0A4R4QBL7_9ACTN|nr:pyridoxamine 5'-phosphate oxidase family protein [Kribbella albertanoniae]TDC32509.1 pyridoxamine 5'-phosphate oxidase [Kribbella albertanoniae]
MDIRAGLERVRALGRQDFWLAVLVTQRRSGEPAASVVNAGVVDHPLTGEPVVAFVARGRTAKLANLRRNPRATLVFRAGWDWTGVTGPVELAGPDDELPGLDAEALRVVLRDIYHAAGGEHPDLDEYDRAMAEDRRTAVFVRPEHFSSNPPGTDHEEGE